MLRQIAAAAAVVACLAPAAPAWGRWLEPVDLAAPINVGDHNGAAPSLAEVGGRATIAWSEDATAAGAGNASMIHVAALDSEGTKWEHLDELGEHAISRLATANSDNPDLTDGGGGEPWVAWAENFNGPTDKQIRVARPTGVGAQWTRVGDANRPINHERLGPSIADNPSIAASGGERYVAFDEFDRGTGSLFVPDSEPGRVWVMRWSGDEWKTVGGGSASALPTDSARPDLALVDGVPWVAYIQSVVTGDGLALQIRVARVDGSAWTQVGGVVAERALSAGGLSVPNFAVVGGRPVVAFGSPSGTSVYGLDAAGTGWQLLGGGSPPGAGGSDPSIADVGGVLWVAWRGQNEGRAARLVDGAWVASGGPIIGVHGSAFGQGPVLAEVGGLPWAAFSNDDGKTPAPPGGRGCCERIRVTRLTPDWSDDATSYPAATAAALLLSVDTFGLHYDLGVRTAAVGGPPLWTSFAPTNPLLAVVELHGLAPATIYEYLPFAYAGTPSPVFGPGGRFVTPPADVQQPPVQPAAARPVAAAAAAPAKLVLAVLSHPSSVRRGHTVRVVSLGTDAGTAELTVQRKGGKVVKRVSRSVAAGRWGIRWATGNTPRGSYRLTISLRTADGRVSTDRATVRVT
ncbi:hypothetical protein [Solirubrobacter soli]|uniref:hypothetical protein n=1 Tax=Solirubrobacter soli TaxID=363832 RepID=UPI0003FCCE2A|nr:hypothetical protein [Solirubrobacter soli]